MSDKSKKTNGRTELGTRCAAAPKSVLVAPTVTPNRWVTFASHFEGFKVKNSLLVKNTAKPQQTPMPCSVVYRFCRDI